MPHKIPVVYLNRLHTIKYQSRMHKKLSSLEQCAYFAYVQFGIIKWLHNDYNLFPFFSRGYGTGRQHWQRRMGGDLVKPEILQIRECTSGNLHKSWSQVTVNRQLWILVFLFPPRWKFGVNFAFVLTPKSAFKSSRKSRRIFSTIPNSLDNSSRRDTMLCAQHRSQLTGETRFCWQNQKHLGCFQTKIILNWRKWFCL